MQLCTSNRKEAMRILLLMFCMAFLCTGCGRDFDAAGYTEALLHLMFQGDPEEAMKRIEGATYDSLMLRYQESIDTFTENVITSQFDISDVKYEQFASLTAEIFAVMRYEVTGARKSGDEEYEVSVSIQPADIFVRFSELLSADSLEMAEDVKAGKYKGTDEEAGQQILADIVNHAYELLDTAFVNVEYGDRKTVILRVRADENGEYSIDQEDMNNLITKILRLDEM